MTKRDDRVSLVDMLVHAGEAVELPGDTSAVELAKDRVLQLALERLVGIVGEAARTVSPTSQQRHPDIPWPQIVDMRNRVVHCYDAINLNRMWDTIKNEMPPPVEQIEAIVGREPGTTPALSRSHITPNASPPSG